MMVRRVVASVVALVALCAGSQAGRADEDPRTAAAFLQGLRDRGYYNLAAELLESLRTQADAPDELKVTIDYELGRMLNEEAARTGDLVRRKELRDQARGRLGTFTKANPQHPRTTEALIELAKLLVERGHDALVQADDQDAKGEREARLTEARSSFDEARVAFADAEKLLSAAFAKFPRFIPDGDNRKEARNQAQTSLMNAELQRAIVDYEQGQTYPLASNERKDFMSKALAQFDVIYKKYRTELAGLTARMWQGKCYEERGDLNPAMGVYNELMGHADPLLKPLQRHVGYFRIVVLGKRKEYALAADEAVRWLQTNNSAELHRTREGLGVQLELAKNIIAQLPDVTAEKEREAAVRRVTDILTSVVRTSSQHKAEALALLRKYKPSAAAKASDVAKLNYEDAVSQGDQAVAAQEWDRASAFFKQAVRRAEAARDVDKTNYARYHLAFIQYMLKNYYEAAVLADHLARRYPRAGLASRAVEIEMAALADAYNTYTKIDRASDLANLIETARYAVETYPELDQGDLGRMTLGQIYLGSAKYADAVASYESVPAKSPKWADARTHAGSAYWELSKAHRKAGKSAEADADLEKARSVLKQGLKWRRDAGHPLTDPAFVANACDLADLDLDLETGKPADVLPLLDPIADAFKASPTGPAFSRLTATRLQAHIAVGKVDLAVADMSILEKAGGGAGSLTQLYVKLGKLLETEIDALKKKGDSAGLKRTQNAYLKFLTALAASKSGQTYASLMWAGESLLGLGNFKEAQGVLQDALKLAEAEDKTTPAAQAHLERARLRLSAALRGQKLFGESESLVSQTLTERPNSLEPLLEKGRLLEDQAADKKGSWQAAFAHWQSTALKMSRTRPKPPEYFDAWYHAALALRRNGKSKEARQTLAGVMRLNANVGSPEMKEKYQALISDLK